MNPFVTIILFINSILILLLPRRWAALPFLIAVCYITRSSVLDLGPLSFNAIRILIGIGFIRVAIRGEHLHVKINGLDKLILMWGVWAIVSSLFHDNPSATLISRLGLTYDIYGIFFLIRILCQSWKDLIGLISITAIILIPVAFEMIYEKLKGYNIFFAMAGEPTHAIVRAGKIRARGPFAHPILAGTVGAVCLPLMLGIWHKNRRLATVGSIACLIMIFASESSGPILSALVALAVLCMWRIRYKIRFLGWLIVLGYISLDLYMNSPAYYILSYIDLTGGSTGWHRARLIQSAIEHLSEWWIVGTDYTRHWMPTGVSWSPQHTDITSHYLQMGVLGGLPLLIIFVAIIFRCFSYVIQMIERENVLSKNYQFMLWTLFASLFAHAATCVSVYYFDQSIMFFYLTLAAIGIVWSRTTSDQQV